MRKKEKQFFKNNAEIILEILERRIDEYKDKLVEEEDEQSREKIRILVKELKSWKGFVNQLFNNKNKFTGI